MIKYYFFAILFFLLSSCELEELKETECGQGQLLCDGRCVDSMSNDNCGRCGMRCRSGENCQIHEGELKCVIVASVCLGENLKFCENQCVDITSSTKHCGFCGNACKDYEKCKKSGDSYACVNDCKAPNMVCNDRCVSPSKDNCGACGNQCNNQEICTVVNSDPSCVASTQCTKPYVLLPTKVCVLPNTKEHCGDKALPCPENIGDCVEKQEQKNVFECVKHCENGRRDEGEKAVDCGGRCKTCTPCAVNRDRDKLPCPEGQFCDSAVGYLCSKKCVPDNGQPGTPSRDCPGEDRICRADGRCSSKYFITEWILNDPNDLEIELSLIYTSKSECDVINIDWGDNNTQNIRICDTVVSLKHRYDKVGTYSIKLDGKLAWGSSYGENHKLIGILSFGTMTFSSRAFAGCLNLNKIPKDDIPEATKLTDMSYMFYDAKAFNQDIGRWDVSNVKNMMGLFEGTKAFNQDIGRWDVSNVTRMNSMFQNAHDFDHDIGKWNVSKVTDMSQMFQNADVFNQNIGMWNVSNVTDMTQMFRNASVFNQNISKWDVSNVKKMSHMFKDAKAFNQDLSGWQPKFLIDNIFSGSGLQADNYCKMMQNEHWKKFKDKLGIEFDCPNG